MKKLISLILVGLFWLMQSAVIFSGEYKLIYGGKYELCRELNSLLTKENPRYAYACDLPIPDAGSKIRKINWTEVPLAGNEDILTNVLFIGDALSEAEKRRKSKWFVDAFYENIGKGSKIEKGRVN